MMTNAHDQTGKPAAWWRNRTVRLAVLCAIAGIVLARLGFMAFWSLNDISYALSGWQALLQWVLMFIGLAFTVRVMWQTWTGRR